jgi:hypothetical protein
VIVPANASAPVEVVEGAITATSPTTVVVDGRKGTISRHRPVDVPAVGTRVRVELDARGFIRSLVALDDLEAVNVPRVGRSGAVSDARLTVLAAAAAFGASRPDLKSSDVLRIADSWLAWVRGAGQPEEDLP